ncbi:ankyrin repeat domain-containing protein [Amycolatopsis anabasis]|uniref:ankyrin repeat domain-containing protein n=1 Tax=Amycolatopsis anabasis TaxID=1840409 RepID=UPI00131DC458|nr:ankyrin repeat domain-containing protein [Amycolatopsis anabasis]
MKTFDEVTRAVYRKEMATLGELTPGEVNLTDADGRTPLMHAVLAEDADPAVVVSLIDRGADVNVTDNGQNWTAVHFAARDQNEALVRLLLEAGAEVDAVDVFGNTPLWRGVLNAGSDLAALRALLEYGADPRRKNQYGASPLDMARESGQRDVVALLEGR